MRTGDRHRRAIGPRCSGVPQGDPKAPPARFGPLAPVAVVSAPMARPVSLEVRSRVGAYVALTKPRIIELLLVTTLPTMVVAARGIPPVWLMVATLIGGTLAAGGANAINMHIDRDI